MAFQHAVRRSRLWRHGLRQSTTQEENVEAVLTELEVALGHGFANPELLVCALTHRSLANQQNQEGGPDAPSTASDNERLEFLGDAVLGLVIGEVPVFASSGMERRRVDACSGSTGEPPAHGKRCRGNRIGRTPTPEQRRRSQRFAPQKHCALKHHGSRHRRCFSGWWARTGKGVRPALCFRGNGQATGKGVALWGCFGQL